MQPYPEPGSYYPGEDSLPEWFTELVERVRTAQQAARTTAPTSGDSEAADAEPPNEQRQRRTMSYEGEPPF